MRYFVRVARGIVPAVIIHRHGIFRAGLNSKLMKSFEIEPFEQARACFEIASAVKKNSELDVWTYTGNRIEELLKIRNEDHLKLLSVTDFLVDGEFVESEKDSTLNFRGSRNQRIIPSLDFSKFM